MNSVFPPVFLLSWKIVPRRQMKKTTLFDVNRVYTIHLLGSVRSRDLQTVLFLIKLKRVNSVQSRTFFNFKKQTQTLLCFLNNNKKKIEIHFYAAAIYPFVISRLIREKSSDIFRLSGRVQSISIVFL